MVGENQKHKKKDYLIQNISSFSFLNQLLQIFTESILFNLKKIECRIFLIEK